ncbi:hypothetical protein DERF_010234 [Dermatophagoides farinae]|uniref:Uncharacterized protein n=1 Tax=Dermatophagoides farinae TaxID=6954 RepID=A0A922L2C6_DERFA|nr:hypothetical protein DERF_010234 [Dermatophagoides farinae]
MLYLVDIDSIVMAISIAPPPPPPPTAPPLPPLILAPPPKPLAKPGPNVNAYGPPWLLVAAAAAA